IDCAPPFSSAFDPVDALSVFAGYDDRRSYMNSGTSSPRGPAAEQWPKLSFIRSSSRAPTLLIIRIRCWLPGEARREGHFCRFVSFGLLNGSAFQRSTFSNSSPAFVWSYTEFIWVPFPS